MATACTDQLAPSDAGPDASDDTAVDAPADVHDATPENDTGLVCDAGASVCGTACANLASDARNCGVCGHDCTFGGTFSGVTCSAGVCGGATLANKPYGSYCGAFPSTFIAAPLAVDPNDAYIYFATIDTAFHLSKNGGAATSFANECGGISNIHHSGKHLTWTRYLNASNGNGKMFYSASLAPSVTATDLSPDCGSAYGGGSQITARDAIWVENQGALYNCGHNASNYDIFWLPTATPQGTGLPYEIGGGITTDNFASAWWVGTNGAIWAWSSPSTSPSTPSFTDTSVYAFAYAASTLFWTSTNTSIGTPGPAIVRQPLPNGTAKVIATPSMLAGVGSESLAVDAQSVCWLQQTGVYCVANDGAQHAPVKVATATHPAFSFGMDATALYWTEGDGTTVYVQKAPR